MKENVVDMLTKVVSEVTSYPSSRLRSVEIIWMNYEWLDSLSRGYLGNHIGATRWSQYSVMLCLTQIREIFTEVENCGKGV